MATCFFSATKGRAAHSAPPSPSKCRIKVGSHCAARFLARGGSGTEGGVTVRGLIMPLLWRSTLLLCVWADGGRSPVEEEEEEEDERW